VTAVSLEVIVLNYGLLAVLINAALEVINYLYLIIKASSALTATQQGCQQADDAHIEQNVPYNYIAHNKVLLANKQKRPSNRIVANYSIQTGDDKPKNEKT
jgi:hypothetical protein